MTSSLETTKPKLKIDEIITCDVLAGFNRIENSSIDLVITSPPYNIGIEYDSWNDIIPWQEYLDWCRLWIREIKRVLKPDGRFAINVLVEMGIDDNKKRVSPQVEFYKILQEEGLNMMGMPFWVDPTKSTLTAWGSWQSASAPYIYNPSEVILIGYNELAKKQTQGESTCSKKDFIHAVSGIWKIIPEKDSITKVCFPLELPKLAIEILSYKGDIVLDPFMGSGTTAAAAKITGRHWLGFEISNHYADLARMRVEGVSPGVIADPMKKILKGTKKVKNDVTSFFS